MEGGGGGGGVPMPRVVERREHHQKPFLPLDIVLEIAARTDPATLVRAPPRAARGVADKSFHGRLRLRHAADGRFVPSLLRGHLVMLERCNSSRILTGVDVHLVDVTAAPGTGARSSRLLSAAEGFRPHSDGGKSILWHMTLAWRDELRVCDPAAGRTQTLTPELS